MRSSLASFSIKGIYLSFLFVYRIGAHVVVSKNNYFYQYFIKLIEPLLKKNCKMSSSNKPILSEKTKIVKSETKKRNDGKTTIGSSGYVVASRFPVTSSGSSSAGASSTVALKKVAVKASSNVVQGSASTLLAETSRPTNPIGGKKLKVKPVAPRDVKSGTATTTSRPSESVLGPKRNEPVSGPNVMISTAKSSSGYVLASRFPATSSGSSAGTSSTSTGAIKKVPVKKSSNAVKGSVSITVTTTSVPYESVFGPKLEPKDAPTAGGKVVDKSKVKSPKKVKTFERNPLTEANNKPAPHQPKLLTCPICFMEPPTPTSTPCGHIFCNTCILSALGISHKCPMCNKDVNRTQLIRIYLN